MRKDLISIIIILVICIFIYLYDKLINSWSKWVDICVFNYYGQSWLLQGKMNSKTNSKKFKITKIGGHILQTPNCTISEYVLKDKGVFIDVTPANA